MSGGDRMLARIAAADPLVGSPADVAGSPWAEALLEAVAATDPRAPGGPVVRPARPPALRLAIAVALVLALMAGGAYAAYELLRPSRAVERGVESLTLPAPDLEGLRPLPDTLRPLVWTRAAGRTWDLWGVRTAGGRSLLVLGSDAGGGGQVFACPPLADGFAASVCGRQAGPGTTVVVGRARPGLALRAVAPSGDATAAAVRNGAFLAVVPGDVAAVEALDAAGAVVARLPVGAPDGG
ncbi:MAG: hypothetical protein U0237_11250 [Thermoleophilia bacterium]